MSSNDSKTQMRFNIERNRQQLLQSLESPTYLKPKIEPVSNDIEKSHLNQNVQPKIEVIDPEPNVTVIKKLSDQLVEEVQHYDGSTDSNEKNFENSDDDNISVGIEDWNEFFQQHNESDLDENDEKNLKTAVTFDGQLVNDKINTTYLDNIYNSGTPVLDVNDSNNRMSRRAKKYINYFEKPLKIPQLKTKKLSMKRKERSNNWRSIHNAKVKKDRDEQSELFDNLKNSCSSLKTANIMASKINILHYAKKECIHLRFIEERLCREKQFFQEQREVLQKRLDEIILES